GHGARESSSRHGRTSSAVAALGRRRRGRADEPACTPGSVPPVEPGWAAIHLGRLLPAVSCGLPGSSGGQPSNASCLALLRAGFTEPHRSPGVLVVSYTTVSPLPRSRAAVCSLWHCPAGRPGWVLPTALPFGARTFLGASLAERDAAAWPAHPSLEYRARVEDPLRVERPLDPPVEVDDGVPDVPGQPRLLGAPDTVLAGDRAAQPDREVHHLAVGGLGVLLLRGVLGVAHHQRVGVAVAGVRDQGDRDAVRVRDPR